MITITVNDVAMQVKDSLNVNELLQQINSTIDGIAVAINNEIIAKNHWENQQFLNNDNVLIIQATQGG